MENQPAPLIANFSETTEKLQNFNSNDIINLNNDNLNYKNRSFNKLRQLQKLIKKESALKELCKQLIKINYILLIYSH